MDGLNRLALAVNAMTSMRPLNLAHPHQHARSSRAGHITFSHTTVKEGHNRQATGTYSLLVKYARGARDDTSARIHREGSLNCAASGRSNALSPGAMCLAKNNINPIERAFDGCELSRGRGCARGGSTGQPDAGGEGWPTPSAPPVVPAHRGRPPQRDALLIVRGRRKEGLEGMPPTAPCARSASPRVGEGPCR
jgi:hypothetical protein